MQQFISDNHLIGAQFLGAVSDKELSRCYREATIFVLTPQEEKLNFEGFGLVYLEAGAYGLPVVGTRTGGVPDAIRDGETGILVEPGDVDGISAAILRLLTNPQELKRMGGANRTWSETLTWQRYADAHLQAYQEIISR
jgi:glycosyltransferase involved in cell wall biosynthesis